MEIKEAIKLLNELNITSLYEGDSICDSEFAEALKMAILTLEKQEGKKPKMHPKPLKNEVFWWNCPHCGAHNHTNTRHNFCHHCGGRIDWSDEHGTDDMEEDE